MAIRGKDNTFSKRDKEQARQMLKRDRQEMRRELKRFTDTPEGYLKKLLYHY